MAVVTDVTDIAQYHAFGVCAGLSFHAVAPAGHSLPSPPDYLLGPAPRAVLTDLFTQTATPEVGCYTLHDALVAPTGITIVDHVALHADAFQQPAHHVIAIADRLNRSNLTRRRVAGPLAIIYGPAHETWGHWLVDFLPRLWVLHRAGHDLARLRYVVPPDLAPFATALLQACGISPAQLEPYRYWSELIVADTLLLPTGLRLGDRFAPCFAQATAWWVARARAHLGIHRASRRTPIFVSRAGAPQNRRLARREAIEAQAQAAGLRVVRPETLGLAAQIRLFAGASMLVGEYGSGLHNAVFTPAGTPVCALRGVWRHPGFIQSGLGSLLGQPTSYIFGPGDGTPDDHDFQIDPADFAAALRLMGMRQRQPGRCARIVTAREPAASEPSVCQPHTSAPRGAETMVAAAAGAPPKGFGPAGAPSPAQARPVHPAIADAA